MKKTCASEENMKMAFINLIPAIIYAVVLSGQFLGDLTAGHRILIGIVFVFAYMLLALLPYSSFITSIASAVIYIGWQYSVQPKAFQPKLISFASAPFAKK